MNVVFAILLLSVVVFFAGKHLWAGYCLVRISRRSEAEWARIREMTDSDDHQVREQAAQEYIAKLKRGPYG